MAWWRHMAPTLAQVMACCMTAPSQYPILTYHQNGAVAFIWGQFYKRYPSHQSLNHDDVIKWKHFPCYWPSVRGIHRSPVTGEFPSQRPVTRTFGVFFICVWINSCVNNREAGDVRRYRAHYDITVMCSLKITHLKFHSKHSGPMS